jgi:hypothetical protein
MANTDWYKGLPDSSLPPETLIKVVATLSNNWDSLRHTWQSGGIVNLNTHVQRLLAERNLRLFNLSVRLAHQLAEAFLKEQRLEQ